MSKKSSSFWDHPIANIEEALHIRKQIDALQARLGKLVGSASDALSPDKPAKRSYRKQTTTKAKAPKSTAPAKRGPKKKGGLTPEGRAKLAASMKARWAARKKAEGKA